MRESWLDGLHFQPALTMIKAVLLLVTEWNVLHANYNRKKSHQDWYGCCHLQVIMMVFSPSHDGLSDMTLACKVTSCGDSCGSSLGCVCTQPSGSSSWQHKATRKESKHMQRNSSCKHAKETIHQPHWELTWTSLTLRYSCWGSWLGRWTV